MLQYLDTKLTFQSDHVCWSYSPRAGKPLLSYASDHSQLVKNGIVEVCLRSALLKLCCYAMNDRHFRTKTPFAERLLSAKCFACIVWPVAPEIKQEKQHTTVESRPREERSKVSLKPYVHGLSHRIKKVAENYDVKVVFSAQNKIGSVCCMVKQQYEKQEKNEGKNDCAVRHGKQFVVMTCGHVYVGQTGRCINIRLREHLSSLKGRPCTHLALHCNTCGCTPCFDNTVILFKHHHKTSREIVESFHISHQKADCVSHTSVTLLDKELSLLSSLV